MKVIENKLTQGASAITSIGDGKILVGHKNGMFRLWQYSRSRDLLHYQNYTGDEKEICLVVSFFERDFISVNRNSEIKVWETNSGICKKVLSGGSVRCVDSIVVLPNELVVVSGDCSQAWRCFDVWDLHLGHCIYEEKNRCPRPHGMSLNITAQGFLVVAVSGYFCGTIRIWQIDHSDCKLISEGEIERMYSTATLPTGEIVTASHDLKFYGISDDAQIYKYKTLKNDNTIYYVYPVGGYKILTIENSRSCSNTIKLWNYLSGDYETIDYLGDTRQHILLEREGAILSLVRNEIHVYKFPECSFHFSKGLAEIRKNARILSQAYRTNTSGFASLPIEINLKIAVLTFDNMNKWDKEVSEKIAQNYFSKP